MHKPREHGADNSGDNRKRNSMPATGICAAALWTGGTGDPQAGEKAHNIRLTHQQQGVGMPVWDWPAEHKSGNAAPSPISTGPTDSIILLNIFSFIVLSGPSSMPGPLLETLRGANLARRPMWLMRQAGRYLPEYRALRAEKGGFLALVYDTEAAAEITLQPLRRFRFDGAILFSDILIVPYAMGQNLEFLAGEGPRLSPRLVDHALEGLVAVPERLSPIYETVAKVRGALSADETMLGFAGSAWTVATYMVAGEGSRDHHETRAMAYRDPAPFQAIIDAIVDVTVEYLSGQIAAGAEAVQLFDSWAGSLSPAQFERWVIAPNAAIVAAVRARHPRPRSSVFPRARARSWLPMRGKPGWMRWGWMRRSTRYGPPQLFPRGCRYRAISTRCCCFLAARSWTRGCAGCLMPLPTDPMCSTWATVSASTRRSPMSSS